MPNLQLQILKFLSNKGDGFIEMNEFFTNKGTSDVDIKEAMSNLTDFSGFVEAIQSNCSAPNIQHVSNKWDYHRLGEEKNFGHQGIVKITLSNTPVAARITKEGQKYINDHIRSEANADNEAEIRRALQQLNAENKAEQKKAIIISIYSSALFIAVIPLSIWLLQVSILYKEIISMGSALILALIIRTQFLKLKRFNAK